MGYNDNVIVIITTPLLLVFGFSGSDFVSKHEHRSHKDTAIAIAILKSVAVSTTATQIVTAVVARPIPAYYYKNY